MPGMSNLMIKELPRAISRALRISSVVIVALALGSCGDDRAPVEGAQSTERVRLQLNWVPEPEFGGIYAAEAAGYFKDEGLDVEIIKGGPGVAAPQLAASGSVEFAVVGGEQILTLRGAGGMLVGIYAIYQDDPMGIMVHANSPFNSLEQLWNSDSTVACEANLSWVAMLNRRFGGKSLKLIPHTGSVAQFASDPKLAQQCFVFAEPVTLDAQGVKTRVLLSKESGFNPYNAVVATKASYAKGHPETCRKLARALQRGWARYIESPEETNAIMAKLNPAMTKEAMDASAKRQEPLLQSADTDRLGLGAMTVERWTEIGKQLVDLGKIGSAPDPTELFVWEVASNASVK